MINSISKLIIAAMLLAPSALCNAAGISLEEVSPSNDALVTKQINVSNNYNSINASSITIVEITQGPYNVEITATPECIAHTLIKCVDGTLSISPNYKTAIKNEPYQYYYYCKVSVSMPEIKSIKGSGATRFIIPNNIDINNLKVTGSGACGFDFNQIKCSQLKIDLGGASGFSSHDVTCKKCNLELSGGSRINITGISCTDIDIDGSGAGDTNIDKLKCDKLEIDMSGASKLKITDVKATSVEADASGASHINIKGYSNTASFEANGVAKISATKFKCQNFNVKKRGAASINK